MIITFEDLKSVRQQYADKKIVLGSGVFDLLHAGHISYLQKLGQFGDVVVAMVKSDQRVRAGKGAERPIIPENDRALIVDAIKGVDITFIAPHSPFWKDKPDPTYQLVFESLQPDVFYSTNPVWQQLNKISGTKIVIGDRPAQALRSTTDIIKAIKEK